MHWKLVENFIQRSMHRFLSEIELHVVIGLGLTVFMFVLICSLLYFVRNDRQINAYELCLTESCNLYQDIIAFLLIAFLLCPILCHVLS